MPKYFDGEPTFIIDTWKADIIAEATSAAGVTADGVLLKDGGIVLADSAAIAADIVSEKTSAAGVTADGVLLKDGATNGRLQVQELTASGAITVGRRGIIKLNHATVVIAATLAAPTAGDELFIIDTSPTGTAAHTVTLPAGVTFNAAGNNTATLNALDEMLHIVAASATRWHIVANVGSVALSTV